MDEFGFGSGLTLFILLGVAGVVAINAGSADGKSKAIQTKLFLVAISLRFLVAFAIYGFGLIDTVKDEDGSGWVIGVAWKQDWEQRGRTIADFPVMVQDAYGGRNQGYWHLLTWLFFFTGLEGRLPAAALNCFLGAMTVVLAYRTTRLLLPDRAATWVGWCSCLFPSLILWSAQTVKEPVVIFLESVVLYACLRLRESVLNPKYLLMCLGAIIVLMPFRFYAAYVAGLAVLLGLAVSSGRNARAPGIFTAVLLGAIIVSMFGGFLESERSASYMDLRYVERFRTQAAKDQGSGAFLEADLGTSSGLGVVLAFGAAHLFFAPFPWQWTSIRALTVAPEVVYWWWICWRYVWPGLRHVVRRRLADFAPLLLFIVLMSLLYSIMFSNVGLAYRQRAQLLPWLFIIAAAGRELRFTQLRSSRDVNAVRATHESAEAIESHAKR